MGRDRIHDTSKDRTRAHRQSKIRNTENTFHCKVCKETIKCKSNPEKALSYHCRASKKHKNLLSTRVDNEEMSDSEDEAMDIEEDVLSIDNITICDLPDNEAILDNQIIINKNDEDISDVISEISVSDLSREMDVSDAVVSFLRPKVPDSREYILMNTSLQYGKISMYQTIESPILLIQQCLKIGFNKVLIGQSPYAFSKIKNRDVDWLSALELTRDYVDSNESVVLGDRRLHTTSNVVRRESGKTARIPKRINTLVNGFCKYLKESSSIVSWTGGFFDEFLDAKKKKAMKDSGCRWRPLKGHFIPLESAIAQILLRINVDQFDCNVGPVFRERKDSAGVTENVRVYNSYNSSKYAIELQRKINTLFLDDLIKPLVLCFALWVDKSPLNSSMSRKATPVMMFLMNDKTRTPFRIGYAPDDYVNNQESLESILNKQNVSQAASVTAELIREYKRQALMDYLTAIGKDFLEEVVNSKGMDVQVGLGSKREFFRVYPVLSHFITDNMQAIELCCVNKDHCRMCTFLPGSDFAHFLIGTEKCRPRDIALQKEVCAKYSKNEIIRVKNIADGHNSLFLSKEIQKDIKTYSEQIKAIGGLSCNNRLYELSEGFQDIPGVISIGRFFPSDFLHTLNQGIVQYLLGWTLQMLYVLPLLDDGYADLPSVAIKMIQEFPAHNAFNPIRHHRFDDVTSLIKQEKKVLKYADYTFDKTGIVALTETWKLMTALFQLLFAIVSGNVFPSDLNWGISNGICEFSINIERCFINAIVACVEVYWYADAQDLSADQVNTYRQIINNAQSHIIVLHHVRMLLLNKIARVAFENAEAAAERRRKKKEEKEGLIAEEGVLDEDLESSNGVKNSTTTKDMQTVEVKENVQCFNSSTTSTGPKVGKRFQGTLKFHLLQHLPQQVEDFGSVKENVDTSIMESTNKVMSENFEKSSKRFESTNREMLQVAERNFHLETTFLCAKDVLALGVDDLVKISNINQVHLVYYLTIDNKKRPKFKRTAKDMLWKFGNLTLLPWHPQFRTVQKMRELLDYSPPIFQGDIHEFTLLKTVKFTPKDKLSNKISEFTIYCDPHFEVNAYANRTEEFSLVLNRHSVIEYVSNTLLTTCFGQTIGIVEFAGTIHLIVSRLIEEDTLKTFRKLPYPIFKYAMEPDDSTRFAFEHVPICDVLHPCFCVPAIDHKHLSLNHMGKHHSKIENISYFYIITTARTKLTENLDYADYLERNAAKHPWDKKKSSESCFNFPFYLTDEDKYLVRDVINK